MLAAVPEGASVEAPDALLPHLAERRVLHRRKGFAGNDDAVVVEVVLRVPPAARRKTDFVLRFPDRVAIPAEYARAELPRLEAGLLRSLNFTFAQSALGTNHQSYTSGLHCRLRRDGLWPAFNGRCQHPFLICHHRLLPVRHADRAV